MKIYLCCRKEDCPAAEAVLTVLDTAWIGVAVGTDVGGRYVLFEVPASWDKEKADDLQEELYNSLASCPTLKRCARSVDELLAIILARAGLSSSQLHGTIMSGISGISPRGFAALCREINANWERVWLEDW